MTAPQGHGGNEGSGVIPGFKWRLARRLAQTLAFVAILGAPLLGGWQRLDRAEMANWNSDGAELPLELRDQLPMGQAPSQAYDMIQLVGGGAAVDYFGIPVVDPIAGAVALMVSPGQLKSWVALLLVLLIAALAGRVFCGWFCPFGTIARAMDWFLDRLPYRPPRFAIPEKRPLRWGLLALSMLSGAFGVHLLLYISLPHLLVQQTVYAAWLLGGGSAVLSVFLGLLLAGAFFGPTTYCAALCPTGAVLGLVGSRRVVRLQIASTPACGLKCMNCDRACWLQLDPSSGDPGPDCDLCTRCFGACQRTNLRVGLGQGPLKPPPGGVEKAAKAALLLLAFGLTAQVLPSPAVADTPRKPVLVLEAEQTIDGVTVAVSVVDMTGIKLGVDSEFEERGVDLSVFMARGERGEPDERGLLPTRDVYQGPVTVRLIGSRARTRVEFDEPNHPVSTPLRTIYKRRIAQRLLPGDRVMLEPVPGWVAERLEWTVPHPGVAPSPLRTLGFFAAALLIFMGLLSFALSVAPGPRVVRIAPPKLKAPRAGAGK